VLTSNGPTRRRAGVLAGVTAVAAALLMMSALTGPSARAQVRLRATAPPAVTGNDCPTMVFAPNAALYPAQPSFHAGYINVWQKYTSTTARWAYVITAQFPYSQWMQWNIYNNTGVPTFTFNRTATRADPGSVNPFQDGVPVLARLRSYHLYLMPADTPPTVIASMKSRFGAGNVGLLPPPDSTTSAGRGWGIVMRSYWSFAFNGEPFTTYDRFGFGGPTNTPYPKIHAFLTNAEGGLTTIPAGNCGAQSRFPKPTWYNPATGRPVITAAKIPRPVARIVNPPQFLLNHGFLVASSPPFAPPTPVPPYVQFFRNSSAQAPFADVSQIPAKGTPPDACGGYVVANLPNNRVSLVHVPEIPTFPNYTDATATTPRDNSKNVDFWSMIMYGVNRQIFTYYSTNPVQKLRNSELANQEVAKNKDKSATFVIYPASANIAQIARIDAIVKANRWNILHGGVQTRKIPLNILVIREKGQNSRWPNAISANDETEGAPCYYSNPDVPTDFPFDKVPANYQATQDNGMGLTVPNGQNCTIRSFVTGRCLQALIAQYKKFGWKWNAAGTFPGRQR
jgi:hypothetical protein